MMPVRIVHAFANVNDKDATHVIRSLLRCFRDFKLVVGGPRRLCRLPCHAEQARQASQGLASLVLSQGIKFKTHTGVITVCPFVAEPLCLAEP
jgi:hypothetical protein